MIVGKHPFLYQKKSVYPLYKKKIAIEKSICSSCKQAIKQLQTKG